MITFYDNDLSTCAQKVRLLLNEKEADWETIWLDLRAGDQKTPDYMALNPKGVVPTIVDDGKVIVESNNILFYLDEKLGETRLIGDDPLERHRTRSWLLDLDVEMHAAIGALSVGIAFRHDYIERGPEVIARHLTGTPDPARRERWKEAIEKGTATPQFEHALGRWLKTLDRMDELLAERPWLNGDRLGLIDIAYAPYATRLEQLGIIALRQPAVSRVVDWLARLQSRPAYRAAITDVVAPEKIARLHRFAALERANLADLINRYGSA